MSKRAYYACTKCDYRFTRDGDFNGPCPYCGERSVKKDARNGAEKLLRESLKFSDG